MTQNYTKWRIAVAVANLLAQACRHGIPAVGSRNTAVLALAADLPAPVLTSPIGLSTSTTDDWAHLARADWTAYIAVAQDRP
jgi:hypothetical protein